MMLASVAVLVLAGNPAATAAAPPAKVFVCSAPAPGRVTEEEERGLRDSVADLSDALRRRKTDFSLVDTADEADIVVEVVGREERNLSQGGFGGAAVTPFRETILRINVAAGERRGELKGIGRPSWKSAAKDAAERLVRWMRRR